MPEPRSWTLTIDGFEPLSLNDRTHRMARAQLTAEWVGEVVTLVKAERIPRLQRIHVRLEAHPPIRRRRDRDNLAATLKPCIDGLVRAGVVPDDTPDRVVAELPTVHPPAELEPAWKRRWRWHLVVTEVLTDAELAA